MIPATGGRAEQGYVEYRPAPALQEHVECFWSRVSPQSVPARRGHRILPDGCIDIVLGFSSGLEAAQIVGTMTRPLLIAPDEPTSFVGVRFRPGKAYALLGIPAFELTDLRVPLTDAWHDATATLDDLAEAHGISARIRVLEHALAKRLAAGPTPSPDVDAAVQIILAAGGNLPITSLAPALGVTRQHLARRFAQCVGIPPKTFARVVRLRRLLACVRDARHIDWSALALDLGYYDQSHLVDEVRALTGLAPRQCLAEQ